jgi:hypothetical protein
MDMPYDIHVSLIKFDREKYSVVPLMKYIDMQSYQDCAVDNVHKLGMSYFGVRSAVPISESLRKEEFCGIQDKDPGKWQADVKGTFHNLYCCFRNLKPKHRMNLEHVGIRQLHCSHCGNHRTLCECQWHVPPEDEDGNECVMFYSTRLFGDGKNRIVCSGPESEAAGNKNWIVFSDGICQRR